MHAVTASRRFTQVFLSYSRRDSIRASALRRLVELCGSAVFFDDISLRAGDPWCEKISQKLSQAEVVLVLWTKHASESKWVTWEWKTALSIDSCQVSAVCGDGTPLPHGLDDRQAIDTIPLLNHLLHEQQELSRKGIPKRAIAARIARMLEEAGIELRPRDRLAAHIVFAWYSVLAHTLFWIAGLLILVFLFASLQRCSPNHQDNIGQTPSQVHATDSMLSCDAPPRPCPHDEAITTELDNCIAELLICSLDIPAAELSEIRRPISVNDGPLKIVRQPGSKLDSLRFGPRTPIRPRVRHANAKLLGALDKDIIRRIVRAHINETRYCYNRALIHYPRSSGRLAVQFEIAEAGNVTSTQVVEDRTSSDGQISECILQSIRNWSFPRPREGGSIVVVYPFYFSVG